MVFLLNKKYSFLFVCISYPGSKIRTTFPRIHLSCFPLNTLGPACRVFTDVAITISSWRNSCRTEKSEIGAHKYTAPSSTSRISRSTINRPLWYGRLHGGIFHFHGNQVFTGHVKDAKPPQKIFFHLPYSVAAGCFIDTWKAIWTNENFFINKKQTDYLKNFSFF